MKINLRQKAKSALSILLTLCMILSVLTVGIVSTGAAEVDIEDTGAVPSTIYLKAGSNWDDADFDLKTAFNSGGDVWTNDHSSYVFTISVPSGATSGTFCRMNPSNHSTQWNYDGFTLDSNGKDLYVQNSGWDSPGGTWYKKTAYDDLSDTIGSGSGSKHAVGRIYFDNSDTGWTGTLYFVVAHGSYVRAYAMSKITGTNLYYVNQTNDSWSDAKYYGVMASSSALSSTWTKGTSSTYAALASESSITNYAIPYSGNFNMNNSSSTYILNHSVSNSKATITEPTYTSSGYSYYNHNQTIQARIPDGSGWKNAGSGVASLSINSYVLSSNGTSSTATTSGSNGSVSRSTAYTSSVTMTATASSSAYVFAGWGTSASTIDSSLGTGNYVYSATNSTKTIYAFFELGTTPLPTPTWSSSSVAVNAGTAATLTVSNHSTIKGQDSGVTYVLKKGSTTLTSGTDYTFNNSTGVFTLSDTTTAAAGSYTVQAIAADTTTYEDSAVSSPATLTVYEPLYCLVGNDIRDDAFLINGVEPTKTKPSGTNSWFNTWQESYAVKNTTATPGVYTITFTVKDDYEWKPDVGIYLKNDGQKAFILDGTSYNTSANGDLTVTDEGFSTSDNLYVNNLGTPAGGSLVLKRGQTYTITIDQTKRYNNSSSYPWGQITVTTSDIFADVAAKKQVFNATSGSYESTVDCEASIGTASAQPVHNAGSLTTTLTAVDVNANYDFIGWYTNADCTGTPAIAASACTKTDNTYTTSVTISTTTEYYALFKQKQPTQQYTVTLTQPSYGEISTTGGVSDGNAYQGATVSLNATVTDHSKEFSHWLITNAATDVDITSTVCANPTLQSTTFTMPALNVKVTAIYSNKTQVSITTSSNNTDLGTASYTAGTYYVGDEIPVTATNFGGVFSRWVVTGGTVANAGSASTTIVATGSTVTARAIFDYKTYQLYYNGKYYPLLRQDDGSYVSTFKIPSNSSDFTVYNASDKKYAVSGTGSTWEFNASTRNATIYNSTTANNSAWASSVGKQYKNTSAGAAAYMVFYPPGYKISSTTYGNGLISLVTDNPLGTVATVYAKDGSIRYANGGTADGGGASSGELWSDGGDITAKKGVTKVTKINSTTVTDPDSTRYPDTVANSDHLKIYSAPIGSTITIQTTVNETYKNQGFYVGMFVINGWKVAASDAGKGVYTATYTLTDEYAENNLSSEKSFEITPVYYNKNFQYVTFYVDANSVPSKWKTTISTCADYRSTDGTSAASSHFEGSYPGQPLGREGDLYEIKVAKYFYDYSSTTGKWTEHPNYYPSATITAYNYDSVHHYYYVYGDDNVNTSNNKNYQTYDFADFSYLAQIDGIEAILFRCKYETSKNNWQIYNVTDDNSANYDPNSNEPSWYNVSSNTSLNTWQWLTDYYGNPIDAFGNRIVKSGSGESAVYYTAEDLASLSPTTNEQVRIVSYGNKMSTGTTTVRTKAQWATGWVVYTKGSTSGTKYFKAYGTPADFICTTPGDTSTANVKYYSGGSASDIKGKLTIISYDKERTNKISGVGDTGQRIDGQWYYSAQHDFDSTVQVHITTAEGTAVKNTDTSVDANSAAAANTGWKGTTSNTLATLDGKTTETYSNVTTEAALNCTLGSGYTFVGWYIYDGTNYTKIGDNFADQNTTMTMKKNYTIVAVVRKVGAGDLVITHSRYTGSKPEAHDGNGKYYVSAVLNKGTANEKTIAEAQNSITVSGLKATDKLTITIRTVCNGADTFYAWYEEALGANYSRTGNYYEICSETEDPLGESEVSYQFFEADCSTFFNGSSLARNTIDLYSDIVHVSAYATLTYKYYDRFAQNGKNQMVSYVVKDVPLTDEEIDNGYIPTDAKIAQYAPKVVDTIYTDTKWTIAGTKVERAASNVMLMATQTPKTCFVEYVPGEQVGNDLLKGKTTELPVTDIVTWNTRIVDYNSWLIDENADMSNPDESDFYVNAPATYTDETTGKTWTFVRFDVYEYNRLTGEIGDVIYSSNDHTFGYRIYADCVIYPVYTDEELVSKQLTAKIEPAVLNREVYGDSLNPTDKLYADLLISFINVAAATGNEIPEEIKNLAADSGYTIETGFVLDKTILLSDTDFNTLKTAAQEGATDTTDTILTGYTSQFNASTAESVAKGTATTGFSKYVLDNAKLTNKNRTDGVVRFSNSEAAQKKVYAAYSYIIINMGSELTAFAISDAQLFNFCYLGNKPLEKVS